MILTLIRLLCAAKLLCLSNVLGLYSKLPVHRKSLVLSPDHNKLASITLCTKSSAFTLDGAPDVAEHIHTLNSYKSELNNILNLPSSAWRGWTDRLKPSECFVPEKGDRRVGRDNEIKRIWTALYHNDNEGKASCYYIHGSPGMGKSFVLRELMRKNKNDTKHIPKELVEGAMFVELDFNHGVSTSIKGLAGSLDSWDSSLLPLLRVFHREFLGAEYAWVVLIKKAISFVDKSPDEASPELIIIDIIRGLLKAKCALLGHENIIVLVDELGKADFLSNDSPDKYRSAICSWSQVDSPHYFAHKVLFSCLDRELMRRETTASGRPIKPATSLPLFNMSESMLFLENQLRCSFSDSNGLPVDRKQVIAFLAMVSGGHPRSLEYLVDGCNVIQLALADLNVEAVVIEAGKDLSQAYPADLWGDVIKLALLGDLESLPLSYTVPYTNETFESLINRGMLLGSLSDDEDGTIKPVLPEMFLYWWSRPTAFTRGAMELNRSALRWLLTSRQACFPDKWQTFHNNYEALMRTIRLPTSTRRPLYELYGGDKALPDIAHRSPATRLLVDGKASLKNLNYIHGTKLELRPYECYHPTRDNYPGWSSLIIYEAFPEGLPSDTKYLLPVFIHTKRSSGSTAGSTIGLPVIKTSHARCRSFLDKYCSCAPGYQFLPPLTSATQDDNDFVLVFIARAKHTAAAVKQAPANVLPLFAENMVAMYGTVFTKYIDGLLPEREIRVRKDDDRDKGMHII